MSSSGVHQLDSLMGATIQRTRYSSSTKRILTDESLAPGPDADVKVISGVNLLSNNQVSSLVCFPSIR